MRADPSLPVAVMNDEKTPPQGDTNRVAGVSLAALEGEAVVPNALAPVVVFAFRRPLETLQTLWSLGRCPEARDSHVYIYCDGSRGYDDEAGVRQTREVVAGQRWFANATIIERETNWGLARSVVDGVTAACSRHGRVIVVEDDLLVSSGFLRYMNHALGLFQEDARVMQVSGHSFPLEGGHLRRSPGLARLLPVSTTWGWATWSRAWRAYQAVPENLHLLDDERVSHAFDLDGAYGYTGMLRSAVSGRIDSWGIRWWWSVFQRGGLVVFPFPTLVRNIGYGSVATNTNEVTGLLETVFNLDAQVGEWTETRLGDETVFADWKRYIRSGTQRGTWQVQAVRSAWDKLCTRLRSG